MNIKSTVTSGIITGQYDNDSDLEFYTIYTLVDITDSGVIDSESADTVPYNQSQNLNVLLQIVGLRTQPIVLEITSLTNQNMKDYEFGNSFKGTHSVWIVKFANEYKSAWNKDGDYTYYLRSDCDGIAFIPHLQNTAKFVVDVFNTNNSTKRNIYFKKIDNI